MTVAESKTPEQETPPAEAPPGIQIPAETEPKTTGDGTPPKGDAHKHNVEGKTFTEDDIQKARKEEKDKLYKSLEDMKGELAALRKEREDREKATKEAEKQAAAEAKAKADEEKSAKELLAQKEQEWEERFSSLQQARERDQAILEQERQFNALMEYRTQRMGEEQETIMPELLDLISGSTQEEIENSIAAMKERTARIMGNVQAAQQQARQQMPGTKVTSPPVGPVENQPGYETLSADDIRGMDMATYAKRRDQLLGAAGKNRNKGLFG